MLILDAIHGLLADDELVEAMALCARGAAPQTQHPGAAGDAPGEWHREWRAAFREAIDTMECEIETRADEDNVRRMKRAVTVLRGMLGGESAALAAAPQSAANPLRALVAKVAAGHDIAPSEWPEDWQAFARSLPGPQPGPCQITARARPANVVQAEGIRHQMPMIRVACISLGGITLTVPVAKLQEHIKGLDDSKADHEGDESDTYHLTFRTMLKRDYEALGEFDGF